MPEVSTNLVPKLAPPRELIPEPFWEAHGLEVAGGVILLAVILVLWIRLRRRKPSRVRVPAFSRARADLEELQRHPADVPVQSARILRRFAQERFDLPRGELTSSELAAALERVGGIEPSVVEAATGFLRRCDAIKFAPALDAPPGDLAATALELLQQLETAAARSSPPPRLAPESSAPKAAEVSP